MKIYFDSQNKLIVKDKSHVSFLLKGIESSIFKRLLLRFNKE